MTAVRFPLLLLLLGSIAEANIHGLDSVRVVPASEPPAYDLDQIETEVAETVKRSERNLRIQVALLRFGPTFAGGNECGFMFGLGLLCETVNAVESAVARVEAWQTIDELKQAHTESDPELAPDLADDVDRLLSSNLLQVRLARAIGDVIKEQTNVEVHYGQDTTDPKRRLDAKLLRVQAIGRKTDPRVAIRLTGRLDLVDTDSETTIDSYEYTAETPPHLVETWSQGGVALLASSVTDSIKALARVLAEEVLLTVTSPNQRRKGYLVQAITPKNKVCFFGCKFHGMGNYGYFPTKTLTPAFSWADFRDAYAEDPLYANVAAKDLDISYDLRIFRAVDLQNELRVPLVGPTEQLLTLQSGEQLYEFRGITETSFRPDVAFQACTPYTWTVRARFVARSKVHLTQWAGNYNEKKIEEYRQDRVSEKAGVRISRSVGGFMGMEMDDLYVQGVYFYPFLVTAPGQKCKEQDIRAAMAQNQG